MAEEQLFYRFRTLKHIFEYKELENQEIYFSSYEDLNDPMEFYQNIVFNGDEVVWHNFFKHYLMSLYLSIQEIIIRANSDISILKFPTILRTNIDHSKHIYHKEYFYKTYRKLREEDKYNTIVNQLTNITITKYQLLNILLLIHLYFTKLVLQHIGIINNIYFKEMEKLTLNELIHLIGLIKANTLSNTDILINYNLYFSNLKKYIDDGEYSFIYYDFPYKYIEHLPSLITYKMGIACFTETYNNSYMWSLYADKNNGIALIYKTYDNYLNLAYSKTNKFEPNELHKVQYGKKHKKINFFKYNYLTFYNSFNQFWNFDSIQQNKSKFYKKNTVEDDVLIDDNIDIYNNFFKLFDKVLDDFIIKTKEWKNEKEYRILHTDPKERKLQYNFRDLHGIIFGIGTPYESKQKIVKIILDKCKDNNRDITDFHFYQAYFNPETNQIEKYEINDISIYTPLTEQNNE